MPENDLQTESSICKNLDQIRLSMQKEKGTQLQKDRTMNDKKGQNQPSIKRQKSRDWSVAFT